MEKVLRVLYFVIPVQVFLLMIVGLVWVGLETTEEVVYMPDVSGVFLDIVIGVITSLVGTVLTTVAMWFAFLRKIPQKTEEKVNKLLDERLNYETANHNSAMAALNPDNRGLSAEHTKLSGEHTRLSDQNTRLSNQVSFECGDIRDRITEVHAQLREEKVAAEVRQAFLTTEQRDIKKYVDGLAGFEKAMETLQEQLAAAQRHNASLEQEVRELREQIAQSSSRCEMLEQELSAVKKENEALRQDRRVPETPPRKKREYDDLSL